MKYFALVTVTLLAAACSWAGSGQAKFVERRGIEEFTGRMIVRPLQHDQLLAKGYTATKARAIRLAAGDQLAGEIVRYVPEVDEYIVTVPKGSNENSFGTQLMATGMYQYAHPDWLCYPCGGTKTPNDPKFSQQWHHTMVKSTAAWAISTGSSSIVVAAVDTGVMTAHPDIKANRVSGYNAVTKTPEASGGIVEDAQGHGTHVTGCMGAIGNNGVGVCGMGWSYKTMMCRATGDSGGAYMSDLTDGARWAASHGASVVSVSFTGVDYSDVGTTGTYVKSVNALLCWAAGNDGRNLTGLFDYKDVIVVGASDQTDSKASFSAYGSNVHVFAPGVAVLSTVMGGGYEAWAGTSMATPLVNGALALIWSIAPQLKAQKVQDILEANCDKIGASTIYGHGRINQYKNAVAANAYSARSDETLTSVGAYVGSYVAGDISSIATSGDGTYFDVNSVYDSVTGGQIAGTLVTMKLPSTTTAVRYLTVTADVRTASGRTPIGMVYLYNNNTHAYDIGGTGTLSSTADRTLSVQGLADSSNYVAADKSIKLLIRGYAPKTYSAAAPAFQLRLDAVNLTYYAQ